MKYLPVQCFLLQPTDLLEVRLRRYTHDGGDCTHKENGRTHQKWVPIGTDKVIAGVNDCITSAGPVPNTDPRWPTHCECGVEFADNVVRQYFPLALHRRSDNGELVTWRYAPPGAMIVTEDSGLLVKLPNGREWCVDSRCSNCTSPCKHCGKEYQHHKAETCTNPGDGEHAWTKGNYDDAQPHACWVRHGEPPNVTVDKNGVTCRAGAGSIIADDFHGFLRNGWLTEC